MLRNRFNPSLALVLCLILQGSGLTFAAPKGLADCGMDMQQMSMMSMNLQQDRHDHSAMLHEPMSPTSMDHATQGQGPSDTECCDVDGIARGDCASMLDCHVCGSMISLPIPNNTMMPPSQASVGRRWLPPPAARTFSPPDLWRPPITA